LDNLLSDDAQSPEAVRENIESSPTFQRFWNSAESNDDEDCPVNDTRQSLNQKLVDKIGENRDDRSISFYSEQQQNENEHRNNVLAISPC
jgi:hypothetical protein